MAISLAPRAGRSPLLHDATLAEAVRKGRLTPPSLVTAEAPPRAQVTGCGEVRTAPFAIDAVRSGSPHPARYVHWNPVKHGRVRLVADWPHSSFQVQAFKRRGIYPEDWGGENVPNIAAGE